MLSFGFTQSAGAVDGAAGFYILGSKGSLAGILPPPGLFYTNDLYYYSGKAGKSTEIPTVGGNIAVGLDANVFASVNTGLFVAPNQLFGGRFAVGLALPVIHSSIDPSAELTFAGVPITSRSLSDSITGIGDPVLVAALGWDASDFHATIFNLLNVPIGEYEQGNLANAGFNRWAYDVTLAMTYLGTATGFEVSVAPGFTFNGKNLDTDYKSGTEFHLEYALMQHVSPQIAIGVNGYYYHQLSADTGTAKKPFEGEAIAIGPAISLNFQLGKLPVSLKAKYLHELDAKNRLKGNAGLIQLALPLWVPKAEPATISVPDPL